MPEKVSELQSVLDKWQLPPRADLPIYAMLFDPDDFGGEENREPWADTVKSRPD